VAHPIRSRRRVLLAIVALSASGCLPATSRIPDSGGAAGAAGTTGAAGADGTTGAAGAAGITGAGGAAGTTGTAGAAGTTGAGGAAGTTGAAGADGGADTGVSRDGNTDIGRDGGVDRAVSGDAGSEAGTIVAPATVLPVPTPDQEAWQRLGLTAFFHFGINTFSGDEIGDGTASPAIFNPVGLDASQWVSTLKAAGFRQGTLVVKHHDGFCLWPTKCTSYNVSASPWLGGKGDVVKAYTDAAHAAGFRVGLYLSPLDNHAADSSNAPGYPAKFTCMLNEILTSYGAVDELWFDGNGAPGIDWNGIYKTVRQLQPHTLIAITGPDIRWVGSEDGMAPLGETSVQKGTASLGQPTGPVWFPSESDVSIRPGWFYHASEDGQLRSLAALTDIFFNSVGRNSVLILNIPPNTSGLLAAPDVARVGQLGTALRDLFTTNLALGASASADSTLDPADAAARTVDGDLDTFWAAAAGRSAGRLEVDLGGSRSVKLVDLREPIALGERATRYHVEAQAAGAATWTTIASGTVIGERNLLRLTPTVTAQRIAVVIEQARGSPAIAELGIY
jgi:alpha-L-fucosidase